MSDVSYMLENIKDKVKKLTEKNQLLISEKKQLKEKNKELEELVKEKENKISELNENIRVLETANSLSGYEGESNANAKRRINKMIREIDKCIALMNE